MRHQSYVRVFPNISDPPSSKKAHHHWLTDLDRKFGKENDEQYSATWGRGRCFYEILGLDKVVESERVECVSQPVFHYYYFWNNTAVILLIKTPSQKKKHELWDN